MHRILFVAGCLAVAACGGGGGSAGALPPPANGFQIKPAAVMLAAGEEKYVCFSVTLKEGADVAVTEFQSSATEVVHHFEVFQTLAPEPDGFSDCSQTLIKVSWLPMFGGGAGAGGLKLPDGAGFKIPKDAQLLLQLHLLNATTSPVSTTVAVNLSYAAHPTAVTPAGIFAMGTMNLTLPPSTAGIQAGSHCSLGKQLDVFAVQPHMHRLGTRITLEHGADQSSASVVYKRDPWVFGVQPIDAFATTINKGDYLAATCTFDNPTAAPVSYGESTKDEMCYFVLFYTPFDHLDGCVQ